MFSLSGTPNSGGKSKRQQKNKKKVMGNVIVVVCPHSTLVAVVIRVVTVLQTPTSGLNSCIQYKGKVVAQMWNVCLLSTG